ncbi:MAG: efflux RND transporter permease subunit [Proteobacteria bacterium]|nr:efflux RND transporter permease subunit [Pseudomonadota bacterium]
MTERKSPGVVAWMAQNPVVANLFMLIFMLGGALVVANSVKQEVEPHFETDRVSITVGYPGAAPSEVEQGVILAVEEAVRGIDGVKRIRSVAEEGEAVIEVDLLSGLDNNQVTAEIKNAVDRIASFPAEAERASIKTVTTGSEVLGLLLYGDKHDRILHYFAESVRDDLLNEKNITKVELRGTKPLEIKIEVPHDALLKYELTIDGIAAKIARSAVELSGGGVKTNGGEILLRTTERRNRGEEFDNIAIVSSKGGGKIRLGDMAKITDGFEDLDVAGYYNGQPAIWIRVFRIGEQTPMEVSGAVKEYMKRLEKKLPPGIQAAILFDKSEQFNDRMDLLKRNAVFGLLLVLFVLGLFLEIRLAFWVTMGIPISFLGSFLFLPVIDVSLNMYSLFAFIVTLGMVVDDAIVIGENIFVHRQKGEDPLQAAVNGTLEVMTPVVYSILTTLVAFSPMLFLPGLWGKYFRILPLVVISVLSISLFESIFVLPAHLGHLKKARETGMIGFLFRLQSKAGRLMELFSQNVYGPLVRTAVRHAWVTLALAVTVLMAAIGIVGGERIKIEYVAKIDSNRVTAQAELAFGVPIETTTRVRKHIERSAAAVEEAYLGEYGKKLIRGIYTAIDESHRLTVYVTLKPIDQREINSIEFVNRWREKIGSHLDVESLSFDSTYGASMGGKGIEIQLIHQDSRILEHAAGKLAANLREYKGVYDVDDGFTAAKTQLNLKLRPEARSLNLTAFDIGRQVRGSFWGTEALKQQRGRNTVRVVVRPPVEERRSEYDVEELLIRTGQGGQIPLVRAVSVSRGKSYPSITRTDGQRTLTVSAEVETATTNARRILTALAENEIPGLIQRYPGLNYSFEGVERQGSEIRDDLIYSFIVAMMIMYFLIAVPFNSYLQPIVVLSAIPFGVVGAIVGHMVMGYHLSLDSMMGLVALSGVVINGSLVLIHASNRLLKEGMTHREAIANAGIGRFRPIFLTSTTTFLGLSPMIFETSVQARNLVPMAISLGFGVLFSNIIILLMVPAFYAVLQDLKELLGETMGDLSRLAGLPFRLVWRLISRVQRK